LRRDDPRTPAVHYALRAHRDMWRVAWGRHIQMPPAADACAPYSPASRPTHTGQGLTDGADDVGCAGHRAIGSNFLPKKMTKTPVVL